MTSFFSSDVNECGSSPCSNGGQCLDGVNGYTCNCAPSWTGQHCTGEYWMGSTSLLCNKKMTACTVSMSHLIFFSLLIQPALPPSPHKMEAAFMSQRNQSDGMLQKLDARGLGVIWLWLKMLSRTRKLKTSLVAMVRGYMSWWPLHYFPPNINQELIEINGWSTASAQPVETTTDTRHRIQFLDSC